MRTGSCGDFEHELVAVTAEQVEHYRLPTAPPKKSDGRSRGWKGGTVQAEAPPPDVLAEIVAAAVARYYDEQVAADVAERNRRERIKVDRLLAELRDRFELPEDGV